MLSVIFFSQKKTITKRCAFEKGAQQKVIFYKKSVATKDMVFSPKYFVKLLWSFMFLQSVFANATIFCNLHKSDLPAAKIFVRGGVNVFIFVEISLVPTDIRYYYYPNI